MTISFAPRVELGQRLRPNLLYFFDVLHLGLLTNYVGLGMNFILNLLLICSRILVAQTLRPLRRRLLEAPRSGLALIRLRLLRPADYPLAICLDPQMPSPWHQSSLGAHRDSAQRGVGACGHLMQARKLPWAIFVIQRQRDHSESDPINSFVCVFP